MFVFVRSQGSENILPPHHQGDVGFDLIASSNPIIEGEMIDDYWSSISYIEYETEVAIEPPPDYFALLFPRSSISKKNLNLANSVGVIDQGYRNTINVRFNYIWQPKNLRFLGSQCAIHINNIYKKGDKIAQLVFMKKEDLKIKKVPHLQDSDRGTMGFGSTGS